MSDVKIVAVSMVGKDLARFLTMPRRIYRGVYGNDPNWVPPLYIDEKAMFNQRKYPLYRHMSAQLFLALRGGELVGRIAASRDENFVKAKQQQTGFFGFFESINDQDVAAALLDAARRWGAEQGCEQLIGPVNFNPNNMLGMLIDNFTEPPVIYTPYNPPYYQNLMVNDGWDKAFDFYSYRYDKEKHILSPKTFRVIELVEKRSAVVIRPISRKTWAEDALRVLEIWNQAWLHHPEFVPWDRDDFLYLAKDLKNVVSEDFAQLAFMGDEPVAFSIPLPNINEALIKSSGRLTPALMLRMLRSLKRGKYLRIAVLGVKANYQKQGIEAVFLAHIQKVAAEKGYRYGDMSLIVESNVKLLRLLDNLHFDRYRQYRVYTKRTLA